MDKEELLLRYECEGGEDLYAEAKPKFEEALAAAPGDPGLIEQQGSLFEATGRPGDALAWWRRAAQAAPGDYGVSMHYSAAFLLERLGRLAEAADEWRFIIGWCDEHGAVIEAQWPRHELQRIEAALGAR